MNQSLGSALNWAERKLNLADVSTAHLDALVLLEDITKIDRAHLLSEPSISISESTFKQYKRKVSARAKHIPLAYIRSQSEFYNRKLYINKNVLEPRPESETLIDEFLAIADQNQAPKTVIDIGTGSGALIISAALERPNITAIGVDIDPKCLAVARKNATSYNLKIDFYCGNLLSPIPKKRLENEQAIILANLPYIPDDWHINQAASYEPEKAIFGGPDGLKLYRKLFKQLNFLDQPPEWVLAESMPPQHDKLTKIAALSDYKEVSVNDFVLVFKHF